MSSFGSHIPLADAFFARQRKNWTDISEEIKNDVQKKNFWRNFEETLIIDHKYRVWNTIFELQRFEFSHPFTHTYTHTTGHFFEMWFFDVLKNFEHVFIKTLKKKNHHQKPFSMRKRKKSSESKKHLAGNIFRLGIGSSRK